LTPPYYDSLLAKVIATGSDRTQAIERMKFALQNFDIGGVYTTIPLHSMVLSQPDFINGGIHTRWLEENVLSGLRRER
jgi:acetyl-CoA carboxylase biotin carboxylase subunit